MSASEKLKEIDRGILNVQARSKSLLDALPEIIAVIEAAEEIRRSRLAPVVEFHALLDSTLAALEEKLS